MPTQVQFRRGSQGQNSIYTGAAGEITINQDVGTIHVHDGSTPGGNVLVTTTTAQTLTNKILSGNTSISGNLIPTANLTYNLGSTTFWYNTFYGVSSQARYADLAEKYASDGDYPEGTVIVFGGTKEVTISTKDHDSAVAGVISTKPAYLMNAHTDGAIIALTGRVPCAVKGPVNLGDVLVTSDVPGVAQRIDNTKFVPGCVLGKALETITTDEIVTIEVVVGKH
jgi:hypothetical protein